MPVPLASAIAVLSVVVAGSAPALPRFGDPIEAGGVEFLRDTEDPHLYHPLPSAPRLATDAGGRPRFSLMEFSFRGDDGADTAGALLSFMLTWGLDAGGQEAAERALREVHDPQARIAGALTVREGSYRVVVSSGEERWVLAEGKASLLPGQPIAFSRRLSAEETEKLKAALASDDGVVAAGFLLAIEAMGPPVSARLVIDWDALETHEALEGLGADLRTAAASDAEVRAAFDALVEAGAVEIAGASSAAARDEIYRRFRDEVFETVVGVVPGRGGEKPAVERRFVRRESRQKGRVELSLEASRSERRELLVTGDITGVIRDLGFGAAEEPRAVSTDR